MDWNGERRRPTMVQFKDHITGDVLVTADNGTFETDNLFFKFRANYVDVKKVHSEGTKTVVDLIHIGKMKKFDMWRVEKDIFDVGEKLGELVETKMLADEADFTAIVDYIFDLRAWFRANRETKDMTVYFGPSSTYMSHAYVRNFTPVFVKEEEGKPPVVWIFKETVHAEGLVKEPKPDISLQDLEEALPEASSSATAAAAPQSSSSSSESDSEDVGGGGGAPDASAAAPKEAVSSVAQ